MTTLPIIRARDPQGAGYYGASRGNRVHRGIDCCSNFGETALLAPGDDVKAAVAGKVTKLGYPYKLDLSYRYVQITDARGLEGRYMYVEPTVKLGDQVNAGDVIGRLQRLSYKGITQHYHFEVMRAGDYFDPIAYLCGDVS